VGDRVWILDGSRNYRPYTYKGNLLVEVTKIIVSGFSFEGKTSIDELYIGTHFTYWNEEIFYPKQREGKFIGGMQRFQK
jgi:hypothetical protein